MNNQEIVSKLWNLCNVLRDDGITYQQYVTELTYILFLKMCKETGSEGGIPEEYRWDKLVSKQGVELKAFINSYSNTSVQSATAVFVKYTKKHKPISQNPRISKRSS